MNGLCINPMDIEPEFSAYVGRGSGTPATFGPFTVRLVHDESPVMPWGDQDGLCSLAYAAGREDHLTLHDMGDDIANPLRALSDWQIARNWRAICDALEIDHDSHDREARQTAKDWNQPLPAARRELFGYEQGERFAFSGARDKLNALAALWKMTGAHVHRGNVNGYCQGDWAEVLLIYTPKASERFGNPWPAKHDVAADLAAQAELLRSWMFGDCWGFVIELDGEHVDSCFGFFGDYTDNDPAGGSYVLKAACEALEPEIRHALHRAEWRERESREKFRAARDRLRGLYGRRPRLSPASPLDSMLLDSLCAVAKRWRDARAERRELAALLAG